MLEFWRDIMPITYNDYYAYVPRTTNPAPFIIISAILAISGAILAFIYLLPENKRPKLNTFFKTVADIFDFKSLLIEKILKFTYILLTIYTIIYGFFMLFMQSYGSSLALSGLLLMLLGPIVIRLIYEMTMMFVIMLKNVIEINNKTPFLKKDCCNANKIESETTEQPVKKCSNCGAEIKDETAKFCQSCGTKIEN